MRIIDADRFLTYLIFSKHIDELTCGEVKEAIEMSKVDVLDKIRAEIEGLTYYWCEVNPRSVINDVLQIIDKYRAENKEHDHMTVDEEEE